ncbi:MAG TPA: hypothetical protein PLF78_05380 [Caulobacter sp.]|nr:hypothetical protein [Caulobacter sp.]
MDDLNLMMTRDECLTAIDADHPILSADMPVWSWGQLEDALRDLAASRQQQDMVESLVSATRKQARYLPSGHILKEILCIAWVIADETFCGGREEGSSMT